MPANRIAGCVKSLRQDLAGTILRRCQKSRQTSDRKLGCKLAMDVTAEAVGNSEGGKLGSAEKCVLVRRARGTAIGRAAGVELLSRGPHHPSKRRAAGSRVAAQAHHRRVGRRLLRAGMSEILCTRVAVGQHSGILPSKCEASCRIASLNNLSQIFKFLLTFRITRYRSLSVASSENFNFIRPAVF